MGKQKIVLREIGWIYCFKRGDKFVFLDRNDKLIKSFDTYAEAITFANSNSELINSNPWVDYDDDEIYEILNKWGNPDK